MVAKQIHFKVANEIVHATQAFLSEQEIGLGYFNEGVGVARYERFVVYGAVWAKAEVDGLLTDVAVFVCAVVMVVMAGLVGTVGG